MSSSKLIWISAAESCHVWNENFEVLHKFEEGPILDIAFSQDGSNLAFIQKMNHQVITASIGSQNQIFQSNKTTIEEGIVTALGFSNDILLTGTTSGSILLWDQNKHKLIRKYEGVDKSAVCRIQNNSSIIAAGHNGGCIQVYGMKTGQALGHYEITNSSGLRDLKMSSVKTSLMAAAFNSGTVAAWNTHSNKGNSSPVVEFSAAHQSPATAVALSPVTDILMVSGGLDKNVVLYDFPKKRILKKIEVDSPVSAIEFYPDGTSLVVGTSRGKILMYDLRSISTPVQSIMAHSTSISKLLCRLSVQQNKGEPGFSKRTFTLPISSSSKQDTNSPTSLPPSAKEESGKLSRFPFNSPRNEPQSASTPGDPNTLIDFPALSFSNASHELERKNSSLFSPVKGETSTDVLSSPSLVASPSFKFKSKDCDLGKNDEEPLQKDATILSTAENDYGTTSILPASCTIDSPPKQSGTIVEDIPPRKHAAPMDTTIDFQADFIRRIVHDVEENLREVLRCRFGDLIIQSAQQFITLQNEIEDLKRQIQDKSSLEEEVKQLRNEINQLRNLY